MKPVLHPLPLPSVVYHYCSVDTFFQIITNNTLKKHILNIYKKLHIRNRTQLFKMVREYAD